MTSLLPVCTSNFKLTGNSLPFKTRCSLREVENFILLNVMFLHCKQGWSMGGGGGGRQFGRARHPHFEEAKNRKKIEIYCEEMKTDTLDKASLYFLL